MKRLKFDVFGRDVLIVEGANGWEVYYPGNDGKRRPATDIRLPPDLAEAEIARYLDDLCHEWARPGHDRVQRLD